jgi:signal transduction histidine kinase
LGSLSPTYEDLISRLRLLEESLQKCERLAVAGRYAGAVMHEVNNPLEAIGNLVFLTKAGAADASLVRKNMEVVESQLAQLGEITRKTLSFYREEAEPKAFNLVDIAESAILLHLQGSAGNRVIVVKQFPKWAAVHGRAGEILQVISNFILNSVRALPNKDAILRFRIRVAGNNVRMTIADNGHGIPGPLRNCLFLPYATGQGGGTGMGLWLSKQIVERHHGTIRFRSSQRSGKSGTTFLLTLPAGQGC